MFCVVCLSRGEFNKLRFLNRESLSQASSRAPPIIRAYYDNSSSNTCVGFESTHHSWQQQKIGISVVCVCVCVLADTYRQPRQAKRHRLAIAECQVPTTVCITTETVYGTSTAVLLCARCKSTPHTHTHTHQRQP